MDSGIIPEKPPVMEGQQPFFPNSEQHDAN